MKTTNEKSRAVFHELKVKDIRRQTDECVSVAFDLPDNLHQDYRFFPGQYLTLRTNINGEDVRRSYSICSCPFEEDLRVAIKKLDGGVFSTFANEELKVGDVLKVMTPEGNFHTPISEQNKKQYVAFAAGSGITPIMSIMKTVLRNEPNSTFSLFFGNRTSNSIIFRDEIDELKNVYMNRLEVHHILSREDQGSDFTRGHIDGVKVEAFSRSFFNPADVDEFLICGPEDMIRNIDESLKSLGVSKEKIHFELFTTSTEVVGQKQKAKSSGETSGNVSKITVLLDGEETHFDLAYDGKSVVDAAMDAGADVPFSCKGAVCCTCRARVIEGEVEMDMNYALEPEEVEDGYILTCQTHPRSPTVKISYDE
ncbi:MAG: phenylacetate-CoA oxygenase/reductase subunit PaaK [Cryomorphaceae bacterium]|nr:phenylacetate-CoA oxygenase/reductase subunit PaaK [Cryomorphaceae bacterium]